jgi:hypothetical protein
MSRKQKLSSKALRGAIECELRRLDATPEERMLPAVVPLVRKHKDDLRRKLDRLSGGQ